MDEKEDQQPIRFMTWKTKRFSTYEGAQAQIAAWQQKSGPAEGDVHRFRIRRRRTGFDAVIKRTEQLPQEKKPAMQPNKKTVRKQQQVLP